MELFIAKREIAMGDNEGGFRQAGMSQAVAEIHISKTLSEMAGIGFCRLCVSWNFPPPTRYFSRYSMIVFIGNKKNGTNGL